MSELPAGIPGAEPATPRLSASGIVLRHGNHGGCEVLLGRRSPRSRFMPGHLAIPGGVLDAADRPNEAGFEARCVSREVAEETGLSVPPELWIAAGRRITPPMFPMRFATDFFVTGMPSGWEIPERAPSPEEIDEMRFVDPAAVIGEWTSGAVKLPPPVLPILRTLAECDTTDLSEIARAVAEANALEQRAPRIEFVPGVWMLPVATPTLPPATHTNVWMPGEERFVIVDPGSANESEHERLLEVVARRRAAGGEPAAVLLTHGHIDHTGGAAALAEALGVPLRAHHEALAAAGLETTGVPVEDEEELDLGGVRLKGLLTPGHAPGHLAFHLPRQRILVAGDLVSGISTILIDPAHGDMEAYMSSLRRIESLGCKLLLPGHGPPLPGKALTRLIAHRADREARIEDLVEGAPTALSAIAAGAYAELPQMPPMLTERQTLSHLIHLERRGRVRRADEEGRRWTRQAGT